MFLLLLSKAYTEPRPFLLFALPWWQGSWGCKRGWEETQPGQVTQTDQRDIPDHMASCSGHKGRGAFGVMSPFLPSLTKYYVWWTLLSWRWPNICLPMGSTEWILCFALPMCMAFAFPVQLSSSQPTGFLAFILLICFHCEKLGGAWLLAGLKTMTVIKFLYQTKKLWLMLKIQTDYKVCKKTL